MDKVSRIASPRRLRVYREYFHEYTWTGDGSKQGTLSLRAIK